MAKAARRSSGPGAGFSARQLGACAVLWLGWSLGFGLAQSSIDALLRSRMPNPAAAAIFLVAALAAVWAGARLWSSWRGALGLISIVFALFAGIVGVVRIAQVSGDAARPATSLVAVVCSVFGSVVVGAVLLWAERQRGSGGRTA